MVGTAEKALSSRHRSTVAALSALIDLPAAPYPSSSGFRFVFDAADDATSDAVDTSAVAQELGVFLRSAVDRPLAVPDRPRPDLSAPGEPTAPTGPSTPAGPAGPAGPGPTATGGADASPPKTSKAVHQPAHGPSPDGGSGEGRAGLPGPGAGVVGRGRAAVPRRDGGDPDRRLPLVRGGPGRQPPRRSPSRRPPGAGRTLSSPRRPGRLHLCGPVGGRPPRGHRRPTRCAEHPPASGRRGHRALPHPGPPPGPAGSRPCAPPQ